MALARTMDMQAATSLAKGVEGASALKTEPCSPSSVHHLSPARSQHQLESQSSRGEGSGASLCLAQVLHCELDGEQHTNCSLPAEQGLVPVQSWPREASRAW